MALSRYLFSNPIKEGKILASSTAMSKIFNAVEQGSIECSVYTLEESQRLDHIAGLSYQSASYWWVVAAASGIGWGLQVPPGTLLRIPKDLNQIIRLIS